ncbi:MAG TPA: ribosome biogenesis GTPase Der [Bryobacteraceae bacterium]|nr:ribosome biogenesis GTPase Der [Bryobacteraceae bacterium]
MTEPTRLPSVVVVGRPNVGKSTLFNAITRERRSIVGDEPGITRDRIYGEGTHRRRKFEIIDTGGIIPNDDELIPSEILKQARFALETASHIIFVIDGRTEITGIDRDLAQMLKRLGKPVSLVVNKIDSASRESLVDEFRRLGFADVFGVSAEHRLGLDDLLDHVTKGFPVSEADSEDIAEAEALPKIRVAIIGRPNVGKSTLLNALAGEERSIVSPVAGTTRDSVNETVIHDGIEFVFLDTAGIRRKGKTKLMAEKMSVVMARRSIRMAHVVLLLIDATEGVLGHDATVAGYAHEEGRAVILCVNKWDAVANDNKRLFSATIRDELKFLDYAPVTFLSAKNNLGVQQIFPLIKQAYDSASKRVTTGELNRFLETFRFEPAIKVFYITQASLRPPTFILFTDRPNALHFSAERFLINRLRERFGFEGTPIVVKTRSHHKQRGGQGR